MLIKKIKILYNTYLKKESHSELLNNIVVTIFFIIFASFFSFFYKKKDSQVHDFSIDKMIPKDFVLVPIDIANKEYLNGLIGSHAVANLYTEEGEQEAVAEAIKIIRTKNYEHFLALVPEKDAQHLVQRKGPFYALIQNPNKKGTKIKSLKKQQNRTIVFTE